MASSEVDQKFLGHFAKTTSIDNNYLSSFLFRVLGLSVILAEKLLKARKAKQLDPVRNLKDKTCINHILWLAREGLVMVEQYILPMVGNYVELKVLAYKLRASFYHIFVLFHNDPPVNNRINRTRSGSGGLYSLYPDPLTPRTPSTSSGNSQSNRRQRSPAISLGGPVGGISTTRIPPGLAIPGQLTTNGSSLFIWPSEDYTPRATNAFAAANSLAESLLPGSHPVRLSVKVEYVAYLYDCLGERDQSRRAARLAIRQVYEAKEGMDDESFEDAAEMVGMLGRMMKRGLQPQSQPSLQQPISAPPERPIPPIPTTTQTKSPRHAKQSSTTSQSPGRSPGRGRRGQSASKGVNPPTTQPTTWV
ncbi:hypothetical protein LTS08_002116 [Lithohypha guttulata]|nr:hypothetical protein LTS08_002116 [Lithohypha guttulata]